MAKSKNTRQGTAANRPAVNQSAYRKADEESYGAKRRRTLRIATFLVVFALVASLLAGAAISSQTDSEQQSAAAGASVLNNSAV